MKINMERTIAKLCKISMAQKQELQIKLGELIAEDAQKEIAALEAKIAALREQKGSPGTQAATYSAPQENISATFTDDL